MPEGPVSTKHVMIDVNCENSREMPSGKTVDNFMNSNEISSSAQSPFARKAGLGAMRLGSIVNIDAPTFDEEEQVAAPKPQIKNLKSMCSFASSVIGTTIGLDEPSLEEFGKIVYEDQKWKNGLSFLQSGLGWDRHKAAAVLRQGAKPYGIWALSEDCLDGLINHLMGDPNYPSPALQTWIESKSIDMNSMDMVALASIKEEAGILTDRKLKYQVTMADKDVKTHLSKVANEEKKKRLLSLEDWKASMAKSSLVSRFKWGITALITVISLAYAFKVVLQMYPDAIEVFGWPVFFARMGGMGCACWTAVLYATMSRNALTWLALRVPATEAWLTFCDAHKDLHLLAAHAMVATATEHVIAHAIGTIPGLLKASVTEINGLLGCANKKSISGYIAADLSALEWPACPVTELPDDFTEAALTTMPGLSGVLLVLLLAAVAYTGKGARRKEHFEHFIYLHNVLVVLWPILLFFHGSQGWIGVGFPLVVFTASLPILGYMHDRFFRALRYFLYAGTDVKIVSATVRPGKNDSPAGGLVYLKISQPPRFWKLRSGMYGFLCMPEYSTFQWHPFTICSGDDDPTVNFLIAGVGDWTRELVSRAIEARTQEGRPLPMVGIDGPYTAPTQSALSKDILIAVGAGVGITPFLSLMSTIISMMSNPKRGHKLPLREAHFYWLTRGIDEFLFGRDLLSKIVQMPYLRDRVFLHLHCTAKEPAKDPACYMFREALKRQSKVDRAAFEQVFSKVEEKGAMLLTGPQLPWCWVAGSKQDVLWLSHLGRPIDVEKEALLAASHMTESRAAWESYSHENDGKQSFLLSDMAKVLNPDSVYGDKSAGELTSHLEREEPAEGDNAKIMLPVVFGRPDFGIEVRSIGKARPEYDVDIYICGNDAIVKGLQDVIVLCNDHAQRDVDAMPGTRLQTYTVHYERFG